jgi:hypothetical protein
MRRRKAQPRRGDRIGIEFDGQPLAQLVRSKLWTRPSQSASAL